MCGSCVTSGVTPGSPPGLPAEPWLGCGHPCAVPAVPSSVHRLPRLKSSHRLDLKYPLPAAVQTAAISGDKALEATELTWNFLNGFKLSGKAITAGELLQSRIFLEP